MRNDMLSIGEVSRLKGVGVKALRYYERIGILKPAFVDAHTGYRYYAMHQMTEIDVIVSCVDLGIPLKELTQYRAEGGGLDIAALLDRAHVLAEDRFRAADRMLVMVNNYRTEIGMQEACRLVQGPYQREVTPGMVLLTRWEHASFDAKPYTKAMTMLYGFAKRCCLVPLFLQGMVLLADSAERAGGWYVVVEVQNPSGAEVPLHEEGVELTFLSGGNYRGERIEGSGFERCLEIAFEAAESLEQNRLPAFAVEVWDAELRSDRFVVELLHP